MDGPRHSWPKCHQNIQGRDSAGIDPDSSQKSVENQRARSEQRSEPKIPYQGQHSEVRGYTCHLTLLIYCQDWFLVDYGTPLPSCLGTACYTPPHTATFLGPPVVTRSIAPGKGRDRCMRFHGTNNFTSRGSHTLVTEGIVWSYYLLLHKKLPPNLVV